MQFQKLLLNNILGMKPSWDETIFITRASEWGSHIP